MFFILLPLLFYLPSLANALSSPLGPVIDLGYAAFAGNSTSPEGFENSNVTFYGGIPYAKPPLGELRWRAPQRVDENGTTATSVTDARNWGPPCIQDPAVVGIGSEGKELDIFWGKSSRKDYLRLPDPEHLETDQCYE